MTLQYSTWADLDLGWRTVWDHVDDVCGWTTTVQQYEQIVTRFIHEINGRLPDGVYLEADVFYGPYPFVTVDLPRTVEEIDLEQIVEEVLAS